jgi:hypothetical protein
LELALRPVLREESGAQHHDAEAAPRERLVDLTVEAVSDRQLELVEPNRPARCLKPFGERPCNGLLVLARVRDEDIACGAAGCAGSSPDSAAAFALAAGRSDRSRAS